MGDGFLWYIQNMKSMLRSVDDHGTHYQALMFVCPGCMEFGGSGLHIVPVNAPHLLKPQWDFDGNLETPTLSPSILTWRDKRTQICHSFLRAGVFDFLGDSTHSLAGQQAPMPDLPEWVMKD